MCALRFHLAAPLFVAALLGPLLGATTTPEPAPRQTVALVDGWRTFAADTGVAAPTRFASSGFDDRGWREVAVPHNWDGYEGFRQLRHGDRHGRAWYRRTFGVAVAERGRRVFLFFEGVGSYATVWVNGRLVGRHAGGLTTFTLDITDAVTFGGDNLLAVQADHPAGIRDLPWVCGGCERAYGFSEGTQPFGIFRPVHLVTTAPVRVEPFGVHVWNDAGATAVHVRTEVKNYAAEARTITLVSRIRDAAGIALVEARRERRIAGGATATVAQEPPALAAPHLWSPASPYLYTLESEIVADGAVLDRTTTTFGLRTVRWPEPGDADGRFRVNGEPVFLNGVCDYEHNLGQSHAFTPEQIRARVRQIEAAGFNAFRDAHHPHNLAFQDYWDRDGLLWWTQFGAHVWFDNDAFRANFKTLLREWVKERRNSPSLVLWGLQNESMLPTDFAAECTAIIRELDPTASGQRKVTTCNGGTGTDWDVPQNWTGTYGGNPLTYADDLRRQRLVGEYGAWRSLGLHTEGAFDARGVLSEDRMAALMETKVRLAEAARDGAAGHFMWPFTTHSNPGRNVGEQGEQTRDGIRPLDQVGPANNKGLFTIWGEPLDVYQMYRANYAPAATQPMVYIVSHTWPDRWSEPGVKRGIVVYSNCDEVELFNDLGARSLGRRTRAGRGTHFQWDDVAIATNVLYAEGRAAGRVVARDLVQLHHLPEAPRFAAAQRAEPSLVAPAPGRHYLYRVNCGGPDHVDAQGHRWLADRELRAGDSWGARSWAAAFPNLDPRFGSVRRTYDPIAGTGDDALFQSFRYGRDQLRYEFAVPDGDYEVELYFVEPWYGAGGGADCTGWRLFDVAINGRAALRDVDLWREAGYARGVKKVLPAPVVGGRITISFPRVAAGQAVLSAIAIRTANARLASPPPPQPLIADLRVADASAAPHYAVASALDMGDATYGDAPGGFSALPLELLECDWIRTATASRGSTGERLLEFTVTADADLFVAHDERIAAKPAWLAGWERTGWTLKTNTVRGTTFALFRRRFARDANVVLGGNTADASAVGAMYAVFVIRRGAPPPPQIVRDLRGTGGWRAAGHLRSGSEIHFDGDARLIGLPANLTDCDWLGYSTSDAAPVEFTVSDHVEVYVALDARVTTRPDWLADWIETGLTATTSADGAGKFVLLRHRFAAGAVVRLAENGRLPNGDAAARHFAIVRAVRPSVRLEAEGAHLAGIPADARVPGFTGTGSVELVAGDGRAIEWTVAVGVGDRYGLSFRYTHSQPESVSAELAIIGADGRVLRTDPLVFPTVAAPGRWAMLRARTGSSINAGTYRLRFALTGPGALRIDSLEVE